jgi:hypothetical protein
MSAHDYQLVVNRDQSRCSGCGKTVSGLDIWKAQRDVKNGHPEVLEALLGGECEVKYPEVL